MPFDGAGNYGLPTGTLGVSGAVIDSTKYNAFLADLITALSGSVRRNGESALSANLPMGGNRITGIGDAVSAQDAVSKTQLDLKLTASLVSAFALTLLDDADEAAARTTLGTNKIPNAGANLVVGSMYVATAGFTLNTGLTVDGVYPIYNNSAAAITLTQGAGVTLRMAGSTATGDRTLAARGMASVWCLSTSEYIISGAGLL